MCFCTNMYRKAKWRPIKAQSWPANKKQWPVNQISWQVERPQVWLLSIWNYLPLKASSGLLVSAAPNLQAAYNLHVLISQPNGCSAALCVACLSALCVRLKPLGLYLLLVLLCLCHAGLHIMV